MSRWLWALLGGVVLVAIATLFWTTRTRPTSHRPFRQAQRLSLPRRLPPLLRRTSRRRLRPHPPLRRMPQPRPLPVRLRRPLRLRPPMQDSKRPRRPLPRHPPRSPLLHPSSRRSRRPRLHPLRSPTRPCRRPRPDGRRRKSRVYMPPRASRSWSGPGPIPPRIASGSSSGAAAAGPIGSRWTSSPRPRLSSAEEDRSAVRHLSDRWRVSSGRRAQGERRMPRLD